MSIQSPAKCEIRSVIRYLIWKGKTPVEVYNKVQTVYGDKGMNRTSVFKWYREFKNGRTSVHDDQRSGRPSILTDDIVEKIENAPPKILRTMHVYDLTIFISQPFGYDMMLHAKHRTAAEHQLKQVEAQVRRVRRGRNSVAPRRNVHPCSVVSLSHVKELLNAIQKGLHLPPRCHKAGKINRSP
ncbi:GVQW3 protein, partial [Pseudoatta argentina]